ncbi:MAG TPA: hypothetical protein VGE09_06560 [Pseudoxanthomonas sp.]
MNPTIGRTVHYTLGPSDADAINKRRQETQHYGNEARAGQVYPAVIVAVWSPTCVNLHVILDGPDAYWATSRNPSKTGESNQFEWHWPEQVAKASAATTAAASAMASAGEADTNEA